MTDRELLEAAARAAGIKRDSVEDEWYGDGVRKHWNPLLDDGDALRLAVKLRMCIDVGGGASVIVMRFTDEKEALTVEAIEPLGDDPYAATRRAIVRAAAAIGAGMIDDSTAAHS